MNLQELFSRGPGGILPERGSQRQLDLVQSMMGPTIGAAQQSNSPLLAFLAPMIGGAVGNRTASLYDTAQSQRESQSSDQLLALMGDNPKARELMGILNNENSPSHVKSIADAMMGRIVNPPRGGGQAQRKMREDVNGVLRYLDTGEQVFEGVTPVGGVGENRQVNTATSIIQRAVNEMVEFDGMTREEALTAVRNNPLYAPQWSMIEPSAARNAPAPDVSTPVVPQSPAAQPAGPRNSPPPPPEGTVEF